MKSDKIILIVDDTPENLSILGEFLSDYKVKVALDGPKALAVAFSGCRAMMLWNELKKELKVN